MKDFVILDQSVKDEENSMKVESIVQLIECIA